MKKIIVRILIFLISLAVFVVALLLMKEGAMPLAPVFRKSFSVDSPGSALGFGWLASSLMLSGSPIAATSLSLLDAGVINPAESFAMISGSRLGAAFIVLFIGFIYMLQGKKRDISLGVGLTSLLVTQTIYPAILASGFILLKTGWLEKWQLTSQPGNNSAMEGFVSQWVGFLKTLMPVGVLFPIGFLMIMASLWLFDRAIPNLNLKKTNLGLVNHLVYRPVFTFLLGAALTSITMSVSVSLSLLVPLSVRGFVRRENVIPYIMGANITTFIDTLVAAALLSNRAAITVVLIQMVSVAVVCVLILLTSYRFYVRTIEWLVNFIGKSRLHLLIYLLLIFGVPFLLLWVG